MRDIDFEVIGNTRERVATGIHRHRERMQSSALRGAWRIQLGTEIDFIEFVVDRKTRRAGGVVHSVVIAG